jgi:hypothetical protein
MHFRTALLAAVALVIPSVSFAVPCAELPALFVVQDKSGSMNFAPDGSAASATNSSKWTIAQSVVPALAAQFSNRFRFGAAMYPGATTQFNCSTGAVVAPVAALPTGVQSAYAGAVAGGGTPTAASLQMTKNYLLGLGLNTPAYVLLITDGLPNCNLALNPNTCTATTPGCAANACGLGAKDCLDNNDSVAAAAQLFAAGIKVFVVGFDTNLTAGNNKAVLDAIAAAGGTTSARVATNQAQLTSTLNSIAASTATCCKDVCTAGAAVCTANGQRQSCQLDTAIGCTTWNTAPCQAQSTCTAGQCQACTNLCTNGATRCSALGDAESCSVQASGCTGWSTLDVCGYGELCSGGQCNSCQGCAMGASRCTATGIEECNWSVLSGCTQWQARPCAAGSLCQAGACQSCNSTCTAGTKRCVGKGVESCVANASGCTSWQPIQTCTNFCSGGVCGMCGTSCTAGDTRCQGAGVETCIIDANSCPAWNGAPQSCGNNEFCSSGACAQCAQTCAQGSKRCGMNGLTQECRLNVMGCTEFVGVGQCAVGETCNMGTCIPPCQNECTLGARECSGTSPKVCETVATGCTAWRQEPPCNAGQVCSKGECRATCKEEELTSCFGGLVCTGTTEGSICLPDVSMDAGTSNSGGGSAGATGGGAATASGGGTASAAGGGSATGGSGGLGPDGLGPTAGGKMTGGSIGAKGGCGCQSVELSSLFLMAVALLRRRSFGNAEK